MQVYLVDYGLAFRYAPDGKHKEYKEDPRRCHDGTVEFTSRDAHKGVCEYDTWGWAIMGTLSATFEITRQSPVASTSRQNCYFDVHASRRRRDVGATFCSCQTSCCPINISVCSVCKETSAGATRDGGRQATRQIRERGYSLVQSMGQ